MLIRSDIDTTGMTRAEMLKITVADLKAVWAKTSDDPDLDRLMAEHIEKYERELREFNDLK